MTKQEHNLRREIKLFLDGWGWPIVETYLEYWSAKDLALDYLEKTGRDRADLDDVLMAINDVKRAHGY